jgi:hypothetical protein
MNRACRTNGKKSNACRLLEEKPGRKRPLERPRCTWVYYIKMDLKEIGWGDLGYIGLAQDKEQ